jgi:hypothetical protein
LIRCRISAFRHGSVVDVVPGGTLIFGVGRAAVVGGLESGGVDDGGDMLGSVVGGAASVVEFASPSMVAPSVVLVVEADAVDSSCGATCTAVVVGLGPVSVVVVGMTSSGTGTLAATVGLGATLGEAIGVPGMGIPNTGISIRASGR